MQSPVMLTGVVVLLLKNRVHLLLDPSRLVRKYGTIVSVAGTTYSSPCRERIRCEKKMHRYLRRATKTLDPRKISRRGGSQRKTAWSGEHDGERRAGDNSRGGEAVVQWWGYIALVEGRRLAKDRATARIGGCERGGRGGWPKRRGKPRGRREQRKRKSAGERQNGGAQGNAAESVGESAGWGKSTGLLKKFYLAGALGLSDATEHRYAVVRSCVSRVVASDQFVRPSLPVVAGPRSVVLTVGSVKVQIEVSLEEGDRSRDFFLVMRWREVPSTNPV